MASPGKAYVYDTRHRCRPWSSPTSSAAADASLVNDVALTKDGAWFTDSFQPRLYFVPVNEAGVPGAFLTLQLTGPAAEISGQFNLNGIQATPNGKTLIVAHSTNGELYTVDPVTGASATIAGVSVPNVDGIVLLGRHLWAVQNSNQVTRVQLSPHLTSGVIEEVITSDLFQVPATAARFGSRLAVVNAKFDTGFPPTADHVGGRHCRPLSPKPRAAVVNVLAFVRVWPESGPRAFGPNPRTLSRGAEIRTRGPLVPQTAQRGGGRCREVA